MQLDDLVVLQSLIDDCLDWSVYRALLRFEEEELGQEPDRVVLCYKAGGVKELLACLHMLLWSRASASQGLLVDQVLRHDGHKVALDIFNHFLLLECQGARKRGELLEEVDDNGKAIIWLL